MSTKKDSKKKATKLDHHKKQGKKLVPPMAQIPKIKMVSWIHDRLGEYLWVILLLTGINRRAALLILRDVAMLGLKSQESPTESFPGGLSNLAELTDERLDELLAIITANGDEVKEALRPILMFETLPKRKNWIKALGCEPKVEVDWSRIAKAVLEALPHQNEVATDCQWFQLICLYYSNKYHMPDSIAEGYVNYPNGSDLSPGMIRASANCFSGDFQSASRGWTNTFWDECMNETFCHLFESRQFDDDEILENEATNPNDLSNETPKAEDEEEHSDYPTLIYDALIQHFHDTKTTTNIDAKHEAVFGFAFYCLAIIKELYQLQARQTIISRMGLRTILECYITLAYMAQSEDVTIWMKYREYGIGQAKLILLKLQELDFPCHFLSERTLGIIANEDVRQEYVSINIGQWDNSNLRELSQKAGLKDEYDKFYGWTSSYSHGHWGSIRDSVYQMCANMLHRMHRIPRPEHRVLKDVLPDCCYLTDKVLDILESIYPDFEFRLDPVITKKRLENQNAKDCDTL